jgi:hypothetical protein
VLSERVILFSEKVFFNLVFDFDFFEGELSLKFLQLCLKKTSWSLQKGIFLQCFRRKDINIDLLYKLRSFLSK